MNSLLLGYMLNHVKKYQFDGRVAKLNDLCPAVITAILRWQNDQGRRMHQEYIVILAHKNGSAGTNSKKFSN